MVGIWRGVIREVLAIIGWVAAMFLAVNFAEELGNAIPLPSISIYIRVLLAGVVIVVLTLFAFGFFGVLLSKLLHAASITFEDRALGSVFGFARGVVIVCALVFALGMTSAVRTEYWQQSVLIAPAERIIDYAVPLLPESLAGMRQNYKVI
ncbi:MAG: CvpA family protein [Duodenibacillus sp.]|nr:CvpA family protein [Duodenibacillus sp.]